jgi:hypothetical protein
MTPETQEKKAIKEYLSLRGVFYYHNLAGLGVFKGIADLTAIKNGKCYQIEVKVGDHKQTPHQANFQKEWEAHGGIYICGGLGEVIKYL